MVGFWLYFFLLLWAFNESSQITNNEKETEKKTINIPKMAPNSKFLNPYLDDYTNLQTAVGAFEDEPKTLEENKGQSSNILLDLSESLASASNFRAPKSLEDWKVISFLNSLVNGNKDFKYKKI